MLPVSHNLQQDVKTRDVENTTILSSSNGIDQEYGFGLSCTASQSWLRLPIALNVDPALRK